MSMAPKKVDLPTIKDKERIILKFSALQWLRGTIEVHDEMDEMKQEQESMKLVPKVEIMP